MILVYHKIKASYFITHILAISPQSIHLGESQIDPFNVLLHRPHYTLLLHLLLLHLFNSKETPVDLCGEGGKELTHHLSDFSSLETVISLLECVVARLDRLLTPRQSLVDSDLQFGWIDPHCAIRIVLKFIRPRGVISVLIPNFKRTLFAKF